MQLSRSLDIASFAPLAQQVPREAAIGRTLPRRIHAMPTVLLLLCANVFMTFAWYMHLKNLRDRPLWMAIGVSWGIAFFEYCLQVPANRLGADRFDLGQLKIIQEVITMVVFMFFATLYMKRPF